jgi:hypothetical protein
VACASKTCKLGSDTAQLGGGLGNEKQRTCTHGGGLSVPIEVDGVVQIIVVDLMIGWSRSRWV